MEVLDFYLVGVCFYCGCLLFEKYFLCSYNNYNLLIVLRKFWRRLCRRFYCRVGDTKLSIVSFVYYLCCFCCYFLYCWCCCCCFLRNVRNVPSIKLKVTSRKSASGRFVLTSVYFRFLNTWKMFFLSLSVCWPFKFFTTIKPSSLYNPTSFWLISFVRCDNVNIPTSWHTSRFTKDNYEKAPDKSGYKTKLLYQESNNNNKLCLRKYLLSNYDSKDWLIAL